MPIIINVPKPLRDRLGEEGSDSLVVLLNQVAEDQQEDIVALVEEKFERRLSEELGKFRAEVAAEFASVRTELGGEIASLRAELRTEIASLRAELRTEIATVRSEFKEYLAAMRTELKQDIANQRVEFTELRSEMIKWMFLFWVGQLAAMIGILFMFFRR